MFLDGAVVGVGGRVGDEIVDGIMVQVGACGLVVDETFHRVGDDAVVMVVGKHVLRDLDGRLHLDADALCVLSFCLASVDPGHDSVPGCVPYLDTLVSLEALSGPESAFPARKVHDFLVGHGQVVDGLEEACVVGKASQAHAVRAMAVVETGIAGFDAV